MATSTARELADHTHSREGSPGDRRWLDVAVLWVASVSAYALILFLLAQFQAQQLQAWEMEQIASALRDGNLEQAAMYGANPIAYLFPTDLVIKFALIGLAVVALAWTGRRALAWALPFGAALVSISPAWGTGVPLPRPLGDSGDWSFWGSLVLEPASRSVDGVATWPLILGVAVETALLILPLVAAPARRASVTMAAAFRRSAIPTVVVAVAALASIEFPSTEELYQVPAAVLVLGFVAGAVATGAGSALVRLPAAVAVPAIIGPILLPDFSTNTGQYVMQSLACAVGALFIVLGTLAAPWVHERFTAMRQQRDSEIAAVT